jgi:hypothetical protein
LLGAACLFVVGCTTGRWSVTPFESTQDSKGIILLDTVTGDTWIQAWDGDPGTWSWWEWEAHFHWRKVRRRD